MKFESRFTHETFSATSMITAEERSLWLLKKRIRDFDRCVEAEMLQISFLTITQSNRSVADGYRWITGIMHKMAMVYKKRGMTMRYLAVLEIQPKRYKMTGVLAPHWHVAVAVNQYGTLPNGKSKKLPDGSRRIQKLRDGSVVTWKWLQKNVWSSFGMYFVCDCWSRSLYDYLGKYISKGSDLRDFKAKLGRRIRIFSASRLPVEYQMAGGQAAEFAAALADRPDLSDCYCHRERSSIVFRAKQIEEVVSPLGGIFTKVKYPRVYRIPGEWMLAPPEEIPQIDVEQINDLVSAFRPELT